MFYMKDNTDSEDELFAPMLTEAVETIEICSNDLLVVAEAIIQSCNLIENIDGTHKVVLIIRADALIKLASLYKSRSIRFKAVAQRLVDEA